MPMLRGTSKKTTEENFHEFRHGKTFNKTAKKFGPEKAHKQMIAAVLSNRRKSTHKAKPRKSSR